MKLSVICAVYKYITSNTSHSIHYIIFPSASTPKFSRTVEVIYFCVWKTGNIQQKKNKLINYFFPDMGWVILLAMTTNTVSEPAGVAITTILSTLVIVNIIGNSLVCAAIIKHRDMRYVNMWYLYCKLTLSRRCLWTFGKFNKIDHWVQNQETADTRIFVSSAPHKEGGIAYKDLLIGLSLDSIFFALSSLVRSTGSPVGHQG